MRSPKSAAVTVLADASFVFADHGSGRVHRFDAEGYYEGGLTLDGGLRPLDVVSHGLLVFVLDSGSRRVLRFTDRGAFRDVYNFPSNPNADSFGNALALDANARAHVVGNLIGNNVDFDPGPGTALLSSNGSNDMFFTSYTTTPLVPAMGALAAGAVACLLVLVAAWRLRG